MYFFLRTNLISNTAPKSRNRGSKAIFQTKAQLQIKMLSPQSFSHSN